MKRRFLVRSISAALLVIGCPAASPAAPAEPKFDTRSPRTCPDVRNTPTTAQVVALVQCHQERKSERDIVLLENMRVQMGGPQPYAYQAHSRLTGIDTTSRVYPIRGSFQQYNCDVAQVIPVLKSDNRGKNCSYVNKTAASGSCWKTTFGDWNCYMTDITNNDPVMNQPPPKS